MPRQYILQPGQLARQDLVRLHQLRDLPIPRRDLHIPLRHEPDQLIAGHLLGHRHPQIPPHP
ncbi:MAG: hypothetical protein LC808_14405 [Actinobacteria bacterium]|nr:hypothetical protein [Actinomycetota bacterium]